MKPNLVPPIAVAFAALVAVGCNKAPDAPKSDGSSAGAPNAAAAPGNPDDAATLALRWPVGSRLGHRMEMAQSVQIPAMPGLPGGKPTTQETAMGQDYSLNVLRERPGGGHEVEFAFQSINMSVARGGREMLAMDTRGEAAGDENNPVAQPFRKMVGQKLKVLLDKSNNVERIEGLKEFNERILGDSAGAQNPMASMLTEDSFKQLIRQGRDLPAQPVKPGATWPSKLDITMGTLGKVTLDLVHTFKGWEQHEQRRCAALTFTGTVGANNGDPGSPFGAIMAVAGGQCTGKSWYDPARGMIIDSQFDQTVQLRMKFPVPPSTGPAAPQPIETSLKQSVSIKLVEESKK